MYDKPSRSTIARYADELYPTCLETETLVGGKTGEEAESWARTDAVRHAHTLHMLLSIPRAHMQVLNASGLYHGHQDLSLAEALRARKRPFHWVAQESADSRFLENAYLREQLERLAIEVELVDYRTPLTARNRVVDFVLFTEIAEHLDHTALLNALSVQRQNLADDGFLLVTTPNLVSLPNRVRLAMGKGDQAFFGDGVANKDAGLYGHIAAFDTARLQRLLADSGLRTTLAYTFDWGRAWKSGPLARVVGALSERVPSAGQNIFLLATAGQEVRIPFET